MSTGYTSIIEENPDVTFEEFVWRCARAFGAMIEMRDDRLDAAIPDEFPISSYHKDRLREAEEKLEELNSMSEAQATIRATHQYENEIEYYRKSEARKTDLKARYEKMRRQVDAWVPPSSEHVNLKGFMLDQLDQSIKFDTDYHSEEPKQMTGAEWLKWATEGAHRDIKYHKEQWALEQSRAADRNKWLADLRKSVPVPLKMQRVA
jgi:hypothetical protein